MNYAVAAKLGWSNKDTGPAEMRLYSLQDGRWASPRARVVEDDLIAGGVGEGSRMVVIALDRDVTPLDLDRCALACLDAVARTLQ